MKKLLFAFSVILLFGQCSLKQKSKESNISIKVNVIDELPSNCFESLSNSFYFAYIEMSNNTDSVFEFWSMTCSWEHNWIFKSPSMYLYFRECTRNFPKIYSINPGEKIKIKTIICINNSTNSFKDKPIELGFVHIKKYDIKDDMYFRDVVQNKINNKQDIIWSAPFKLTNSK